MGTAAAALSQSLLERVTYVDIQSGGTLYSVFTLDGAMALWAYGAIANPSQVSGVNPTDVANGFATNYCATHPGVDCSMQPVLVPAYGAAVAAAVAGAPIPPLPPPPGTPAGSNVIADVPYSATPPIPPPPPPIDQSVPSQTLQALITPAPTPAPTPTTTPAVVTTPTATVTAASVAAAAAAPSGPQPRFISAGGAEGGIVAGLPEAGVTFGISIVVGAILGALFGGLFGGNDTQALQNAVQALRQALAQTADELERFSWTIATGLGKTWQAIADIWDNFLDGLWSYLKQLGNSLWIVVSSVLPKLIQVVKDLRTFLDKIYTKYILPAMRYLLLIRQVLGILRAIGVPLGAKLDRILGQLQAAVFLPMQYVLRSLNGYGGWFNYVLTSNLILQRPLFINTMYAYQADWIKMFYTAQSGQQGPVGVLGPAATGTSNFASWLSSGGTIVGAPSAGAQAMTIAEACAWLGVFVATGGGELAPTAQQTQVLLRQYLGQ